MSERRRPLPLVSGARSGLAGLGGPTIMDRTLAADHGAAYVQLAAFAIDVDRVYALGAEDPPSDALPFGWEVFLVQEYLRVRVPHDGPSTVSLLEDTCFAILAQAPEEQGFGSQLAFAVHDLVQRGEYPAALGRVFASWRGARNQRPLARAIDALRQDRARALPRLARHCLDRAPDPGLAPPTREALQAMADGRWPKGMSGGRA